MSCVVTSYKNLSETVHFKSELEKLCHHHMITFFIQTTFGDMSK